MGWCRVDDIETRLIWGVFVPYRSNIFVEIPMVGKYAHGAGGIYLPWVYNPDNFYCGYII
jgi:hypothetical protein